MYPVSSCSQVVTQDIFDAINKLYADPNYADLSFNNVSANISDGYLNVRFTVTNQGLATSTPTKVIISNDEDSIEEVEIDTLIVGYGRIIKLNNIRLFPHALGNLTFVIENTSAEIDLSNNEATLNLVS